MSPDNALIYVDNIRDALIKYDPANAQTYQRNADTYKAKITQTLAPLRKQIAELLRISDGWSPVKGLFLISHAIWG